jgi:enhancing lycopene biosynthesis protein 2
VHANHTVEECHIDHKNKVVTAPAYMVNAGIAQVAAGIEAAVGAVLEMA